MDDNYLDNVFREKMELPQQHDFDESAWLDLESRLEDKPNRRIIPWRWIAAAGILLPMFLTSFYFYSELRNTEQRLAKLETKMDNLLNKKTIKSDNDSADKEEEILAMQDEVLTEKVGIIRQNTTTIATEESTKNTISKTKQSKYSTAVTVINATNNTFANNNKSKNQENFTNPESTSTNSYKETFSDKGQATKTFAFTSLMKAENDMKATNAIFLKPKNRILKDGFQLKKTITPDLDYLSIISGNNTSEKKESMWEKATEHVIPIGFEVSFGSFAGTQIPTTATFATIKTQQPFFNNQGIKVAAHFVNNVDLTMGANIANYSYKTTDIGQDFPDVEPNNIDDIFNNATVTEDVVQIPVGLKYNFGKYDDVFAPFVEIGGIAKRIVQKHHRFEFSPLSTSEEIYAIIPKPQKVTDSFAMNTASVSGGLKWNPSMKNQILDNVVIQAETFLNADFETKNTEKTTWSAGIGVSASYMF